MARSPTRSTETSSLGLPKTDKVLSPTRLRRDRPTRLLLCPFRICIPIPPLLTLLLLDFFKPVSWIIHPVVVDGGEDTDHGPGDLVEVLEGQVTFRQLPLDEDVIDDPLDQPQDSGRGGFGERPGWRRFLNFLFFGFFVVKRLLPPRLLRRRLELAAEFPPKGNSLNFPQDFPYNRPCTAQGIIDPLIEAVIDTDPRAFGYRSTIWTAPLLVSYLDKQHHLAVSCQSVRLAIARVEMRWKRPRHHLALRPATWQQAKGG